MITCSIYFPAYLNNMQSFLNYNQNIFRFYITKKFFFENFLIFIIFLKYRLKLLYKFILTKKDLYIGIILKMITLT